MVPYLEYNAFFRKFEVSWFNSTLHGGKLPSYKIPRKPVISNHLSCATHLSDNEVFFFFFARYTESVVLQKLYTKVPYKKWKSCEYYSKTEKTDYTYSLSLAGTEPFRVPGIPYLVFTFKFYRCFLGSNRLSLYCYEVW